VPNVKLASLSVPNVKLASRWRFENIDILLLLSYE